MSGSRVGVRLLASSATASGLTSLIGRFYGGEPATLGDGGGVLKGGRVVPGVRWKQRGRRYRFESVEDGVHPA